MKLLSCDHVTSLVSHTFLIYTASFNVYQWFYDAILHTP